MCTCSKKNIHIYIHYILHMYIYVSFVCLTWCSFGIIYDPPIASAVFPSERGASFNQALLKPYFYEFSMGLVRLAVLIDLSCTMVLQDSVSLL